MFSHATSLRLTEWSHRIAVDWFRERETLWRSGIAGIELGSIESTFRTFIVGIPNCLMLTRAICHASHREGWSIIGFAAKFDASLRVFNRLDRTNDQVARYFCESASRETVEGWWNFFDGESLDKRFSSIVPIPHRTVLFLTARRIQLTFIPSGDWILFLFWANVKLI